MKHRTKFHFIPLTGKKKEKVSFFGFSLCTSVLRTELQTVASHFINWQTSSSKHFQAQSFSFLRFTQWFLLRFIVFHAWAENKLACKISSLVLWELLIMFISNFIFRVFLFLQLSLLWVITPRFAANWSISQILQDFLNCSILFHLSLFLRGWSVLKKFFSFKNNFAVVLQSAWFPPKTKQNKKIPAGLFLLLLPWLPWCNDTDASGIIPG